MKSHLFWKVLSSHISVSLHYNLLRCDNISWRPYDPPKTPSQNLEVVTHPIPGFTSMPIDRPTLSNLKIVPLLDGPIECDPIDIA